MRVTGRAHMMTRLSNTDGLSLTTKMTSKALRKETEGRGRVRVGCLFATVRNLPVAGRADGGPGAWRPNGGAT